MKYVKKVAYLHVFTNLKHKLAAKVVLLHFCVRGPTPNTNQLRNNWI